MGRIDTQRPPSWERWLPVLFLALAFATLFPLFRHPFLFAEKSDWRYFQTITEVARRSVIWWHQFPLWNPYACGGEVLLANPQSEVAAPTFLLSLIFGTALGMKLAVAVYLFCAFDGMYRLCRNIEIDRAGSLLASVLFGSGGWLVLHLLVGHTNFASVSLFPYLILFYRRSLQQRYYSIAAGGIAAWIIALGGTSTPAMAIILMATIATIDIVGRRSLAPLGALGLAVLVAIGISAFRLFPAIEFAIGHPRRQWQTDSSTIFQIIAAGYRWKSDDPLPGKLYRFHEYGWRLAYVTIPLVLWSVTLRRYRQWWIVAGVGAAIAVGAAIPYGPWWILKHLPIFRDLRVPSRYTVMLALSVPVLCGAAATDLLARLAPSRRQWVAGAVVTVAALDCLLFAWARLREIPYPTKAVASKTEPFYQVQSHWTTMMDDVLQGHGVISCLEEAPLERAEKLELGPVPQVSSLDPSAAEIANVSWSPNRITIAAALNRQSTIVVNENWNEHWKATNGRVSKVGNKYAADKDGGQLGIELPAGEQTATLYYRPTSFVVGVVVSVLSTLTMLLLVFVRRRTGSSDDSNAS